MQFRRGLHSDRSFPPPTPTITNTIDTNHLTNVASNNNNATINNNNNINLNISDIPNGAAAIFGTAANRITDVCW